MQAATAQPPAETLQTKLVEAFSTFFGDEDYRLTGVIKHHHQWAKWQLIVTVLLIVAAGLLLLWSTAPRWLNLEPPCASFKSSIFVLHAGATFCAILAAVVAGLSRQHSLTVTMAHDRRKYCFRQRRMLQEIVAYGQSSTIDEALLRLAAEQRLSSPHCEIDREETDE
jgi:hypothetical protein